MDNMRLLVLIVAFINFMLSLGFALYAIIIIASAGIMNPWLMAIILWAVLSSFCSLCVVYWVTTEEEEGSELWGMERRIIVIEKKLGIGAQKDYVEPARTPELTPTELELVEKLRKKGFSYPQEALEGFIRGKMSAGKTREQAIKEIDEEKT